MSEPKRAPAVERWSLPEVHGTVVGRIAEERRAPSELDTARTAAKEGEARGYQAGIARAQQEARVLADALTARVQHLETILSALTQPLQQIDAEIENALLQLALAVGKQLARRELRIDPTQIIGIIRETLAQLPPTSREARVHLHPEDAATVRERLSAPGNDRAWSIVEDPTLTRGGCLVKTDTSRIDARLESRVNAVIASVLGEERAPERPAERAVETPQ